MLFKRTGHLARVVALWQAASLLFVAGVTFLHHHHHGHGHAHGGDDAGRCAICFVAVALASADLPAPAAVCPQARLAAIPGRLVPARPEAKRSRCLRHPVAHGPPQA